MTCHIRVSCIVAYLWLYHACITERSLNCAEQSACVRITEYLVSLYRPAARSGNGGGGKLLTDRHPAHNW